MVSSLGLTFWCNKLKTPQVSTVIPARILDNKLKHITIPQTDYTKHNQKQPSASYQKLNIHLILSWIKKMPQLINPYYASNLWKNVELIGSRMDKCYPFPWVSMESMVTPRRQQWVWCEKANSRYSLVNKTLNITVSVYLPGKVQRLLQMPISVLYAWV